MKNPDTPFFLEWCIFPEKAGPVAGTTSGYFSHIFFMKAGFFWFFSVPGLTSGTIQYD
jgi:hypothetical protein